VVGAIVASGSSRSVSGEAVVGEGVVDMRSIAAAIELFRGLPDAHEASASDQSGSPDWQGLPTASSG
jgi:hypothetical protein